MRPAQACRGRPQSDDASCSVSISFSAREHSFSSKPALTAPVRVAHRHGVRGLRLERLAFLQGQHMRNSLTLSVTGFVLTSFFLAGQTEHALAQSRDDTSGPVSGRSLAYKAPATPVSGGGYYAWIDGIYDRVRLPSYGLGLHNQGGTAPFQDFPNAQALDPSINS